MGPSLVQGLVPDVYYKGSEYGKWKVLDLTGMLHKKKTVIWCMFHVPDFDKTRVVIILKWSS
jgi:hypothetical protein